MYPSLRRDPYKRDLNLGENISFLNKEIAKKTSDDGVKFTVIGNRVTKEFIYCLYLVEGLHKYRQKQFKTPEIRGVTSVEWPQVLNDLKMQYGTLAYTLKSEVAVLINDKLLGGDIELKEYVESKYVYCLHLDYYKEGIKQFTDYIKSLARPCAYLHISINDKEIGPLIFMLHADIVPRTCENFLRLCQATKGGYEGSPVHRIVKDCWIQCGGFGLKSHDELECENFMVPHDRRGVLCMANDGRENPHGCYAGLVPTKNLMLRPTAYGWEPRVSPRKDVPGQSTATEYKDCSTQFFILLQPAAWMENKYVAFGQLIEGENTLKRIENVPTWHESPTADIRIYKCGIFNLESHKMPAYDHACVPVNPPTEEINKIGETLYEIILENVFREIDAMLIERKSPEIPLVGFDLTGKDVRRAKSFMLKGEERDQRTSRVQDVDSSNTSEDSSEDEGLHNNQVKDHAQYQNNTEPRPSIAVKPEEPEEVDSCFDLQRLLRGDYCLESDLEQDPDKRRLTNKICEELVSASYVSDSKSIDDWEYYLNQENEESIKKYLRENTDTVSFAGPVVKNIAKKHENFKILFATPVEKVNSLPEKTSQDTFLLDPGLTDNLPTKRLSDQSYLKHFNESMDLSQYDLTSDIIRTESTRSSSAENQFNDILKDIPSKATFQYLRNRESILNAQRSHSISKKRVCISIAEYQLKNQKFKIETEKKFKTPSH